MNSKKGKNRTRSQPVSFFSYYLIYQLVNEWYGWIQNLPYKHAVCAED